MQRIFGANPAPEAVMCLGLLTDFVSIVREAVRMGATSKIMALSIMADAEGKFIEAVGPDVAEGIEHFGVDVNIVERNLFQVETTHNHHPRNPQSDNIPVGDQDVGRVIVAHLRPVGVLWPWGLIGKRWAWPTKRGMRP